MKRRSGVRNGERIGRGMRIDEVLSWRRRGRSGERGERRVWRYEERGGLWRD